MKNALLADKIWILLFVYLLNEMKLLFLSRMNCGETGNVHMKAFYFRLHKIRLHRHRRLVMTSWDRKVACLQTSGKDLCSWSPSACEQV